MGWIMYPFYESSLGAPVSFTKLELLHKIYMDTGVPICTCGLLLHIYLLLSPILSSHLTF